MALLGTGTAFYFVGRGRTDELRQDIKAYNALGPRTAAEERRLEDEKGALHGLVLC